MSLPCLVALVLSAPLSARAEDPQAGPPTAALAAALPASAFLPAKSVLATLERVDPREQRLSVASLESATVPKTAERAEFVRIKVDLTSAAPDAKSVLAEWVGVVKQEKAVVDVRAVEAESTRMRVEIEWDPSRNPMRTEVARNARVGDHPISYVWKVAGSDKVEVGNLQTTSTTRRIPGTDWIEERLTITSKDPTRTERRLTIHNFATVLESQHPYTSVSRYAWLSAPDAGPEKRMELELTLLRPARAEELHPGDGKR